MIAKFLATTLIFLHWNNCEWIQLPQITNTPKVTYKIQTVASFADLPTSSVLASSELLSSIFSTESPKVTLFVNAPRPTINKKYYPSEVTSKTIIFKDEEIEETSGHIDSAELEPVKLEPVKLVPVVTAKKVIFLNQTAPLQVLQTFIPETVPPRRPAHQTIVDDEDDYDGVTVLDENESLTSTEEVFESDEYYEEDEFEVETKTTTKAPRKIESRRPKPQKRIFQVAKSKPTMHNHLSFTNFLKFLKNIQDSFTSRTAKTITDKIRMLREFRDSLMLTINQRINSLWKTQSKNRRINKHKRVKRTLGGGGGWMEHHGDGMDFPSAEGALLSISFLTFAVFLIKLVLQVIQTIKMKKYAYGMSADAASNVVVKRNRKIRDIPFDDLDFSEHLIKNNFESLRPILQQTDHRQSFVEF